MQEITTQQIKEKIENGENFILDFYATWCGPCKVMLENLKKVGGIMNESENKWNYEIYKFDIDSDRDFVINDLGIRSVPTIKFYKNGEEKYSNKGVMTPNEVFKVMEEI